MRSSRSFLAAAVFGMAPALAQPAPPPGAADIRAFRDCQDTEVKKLDDGKRAPELVARDLAGHCERQYEAMSAAVLKMFGKPVWMSNFDSSLATVRANRDPNSALNRQQGDRPPAGQDR
jgi:hypothetical protein